MRFTFRPAPADTSVPKPEADRIRGWATAVVMAASLMDLVDLTMVNVALPTIRRDFDVPHAVLPWITGGYAFAFAVVLGHGTRLGDVHGRRRLFLVGIGAFTVASVLGGIAPSPETLVAARSAQGAAAALMVSQVPHILDALFPADEQGRVAALFGAVIGLGSVTGPLVGAVLLESDLFGLGWRSVLLINVPIGLAGLVLGRLWIIECREHPRPVTSTAVVRHARAGSRRHDGPPVVRSLFGIRSYAVGIGIELVYGTLGGIYFLAWCFHMQAGLGWSPVRAALCMLLFGAAVAVCAGLARDALFPRYGRKVLQAGVLTQLAGVLVYDWQTQHYGTGIQSWQILPALALLGGGMGLTVAPLPTVLLADVPREHQRSAAVLGNTTYQLGAVLGMSLVPVAFLGLLDAGHPVSAAFSHTLRWIACLLAAAFLLTFALPRQARRWPSEASRTGADGTSTTV
ncbi:MFS transporter [Streptomyces beigongshangae]|uniref:MFS transporter n=1 Tax=Streptomyces beigongshangae TaxID=2841597 RepID=UPI001C855AB4|nr:MFS transporter [Streptomyces sp. REN17]